MIATGSSDHTVRLWNTEDASPQHVLTGHKSRIWEVSAPSSGAMLASASADATIKLWDLKPDEPRLACTLEGHTAWVCCCSAFPDSSRIVTGSADRTVRLWSSDGAALRTLEGHRDSAN